MIQDVGEFIKSKNVIVRRAAANGEIHAAHYIEIGYRQIALVGYGKLGGIWISHIDSLALSDG